MNRLYDKAREAFANKLIDWVNDDFLVFIVDTAQYTPDFATHEFLTQIPALARYSTPQPLVSKTNIAGVCDAENVTFPPASGDPCEAVVIVQWTGVEATSRLITWMDTLATSDPISIEPDGSAQVAINWSDGPNKIFRL